MVLKLSKKRNPRFLNKVRYPFGSYRRVVYCENCRIKDGLASSGPIRFAKCSYCGRNTRCYTYGYPKWQPNTVANANDKTWMIWRRGSTIWKGYKIGKRK